MRSICVLCENICVFREMYVFFIKYIEFSILYIVLLYHGVAAAAGNNASAGSKPQAIHVPRGCNNPFLNPHSDHTFYEEVS